MDVINACINSFFYFNYILQLKLQLQLQQLMLQLQQRQLFNCIYMSCGSIAFVFPLVGNFPAAAVVVGVVVVVTVYALAFCWPRSLLDYI